MNLRDGWVSENQNRADNNYAKENCARHARDVLKRNFFAQAAQRFAEFFAGEGHERFSFGAARGDF